MNKYLCPAIILILITILCIQCGDGTGRISGSIVYVGEGKTNVAYYNINALRTLWGTYTDTYGNTIVYEGPYYTGTYYVEVMHRIALYLTNSTSDEDWFPLPPCVGFPSENSIPSDIVKVPISTEFTECSESDPTDCTTYNTAITEFNIEITEGTFYAYAIYDADGDNHFSSGDLISVYNNQSYDGEPEPIVIENGDEIKNLVFNLDQRNLTPYIDNSSENCSSEN